MSKETQRELEGGRVTEQPSLLPTSAFVLTQQNWVRLPEELQIKSMGFS